MVLVATTTTVTHSSHCLAYVTILSQRFVRQVRNGSHEIYDIGADNLGERAGRSADTAQYDLAIIAHQEALCRGPIVYPLSVSTSRKCLCDSEHEFHSTCGQMGLAGEHYNDTVDRADFVVAANVNPRNVLTVVRQTINTYDVR